MKTRILDLIARHREQGFGNGEARIVEHARPEQLHETRGVGRVPQLRRHSLDGAAVHFQWVQEREYRLVLQRIGAAVPEQAALRHDVGRSLCRVLRGLLCPGRGLPSRGKLHEADALILLVIGTDAEIGLPLEVHQRRHGA